MKTLTIIPARGGSKGIPGKNNQMVNGKPLIAWMIEAAVGADSVDEVVVTTDDAHTKDIAVSYGVGVVNRPPELATDTASSESALLHVLYVVKEQPELIVFLQPTSPLTTSEDIDGVVGKLMDEEADSALSVVPFHYFLWNKDGDALNHDKLTRPRRQDRKPQFVETGGVYVMKVKGFSEAKHRFFGKTVVYNCGNYPHIEIDEPHDLIIAETLLKEKNND